MGTDIHVVAEVQKKGQWHLSAVELPTDRDYWTFALLANVRNYFGLVLGGRNRLSPIALPRGLPQNISQELLKGMHSLPNAAAFIYLGNHSWSWLSLRELLEEYDINRIVVQAGVVSEIEAKAYYANGTIPTAWSGARSSMAGYANLEWPRPLWDAVKLMPKIIDTLKLLGTPNAVRIVFGFDN